VRRRLKSSLSAAYFSYLWTISPSFFLRWSFGFEASTSLRTLCSKGSAPPRIAQRMMFFFPTLAFPLYFPASLPPALIFTFLTSTQILCFLTWWLLQNVQWTAPILPRLFLWGDRCDPLALALPSFLLCSLARRFRLRIRFVAISATPLFPAVTRFSPAKMEIQFRCALAV